MLYEPTTLASMVPSLAECLLEDYGIDPVPVYSRAGVPVEAPESPQLRYPVREIRKLWREAKLATGDDAIGLKAGCHVKPTQLYAFGYSWLASDTLFDAMKRLERYYQLISTSSVEISLADAGDCYALSAIFPDESKAPPREGIDYGMTALLRLCEIIAEQEVRPQRVRLTCPPDVHPDDYRRYLKAPIEFNADIGTFYFDRDLLERRLPGASPDIARATDKIADQYIESLDPAKVASRVRRLLIALLPSGKADQEFIAGRMNRSSSTLQRQLQAEGLTYRAVLESTRRSLAEEYLREGRQSHAQIAYLLGFSDQSNFSRAFKRWTSMSPRQFQESVRNQAVSYEH